MFSPDLRLFFLSFFKLEQHWTSSIHIVTIIAWYCHQIIFKAFLIRAAGPTLHSSVIQIHFPGLSIKEMLPHTQQCPDSPRASPLKQWQQTSLQIPPKVTPGERRGSKGGGAEAKRENWATFTPIKDCDLPKAFSKIFFSMSVCVQRLQNIWLLPQNQSFY